MLIAAPKSSLRVCILSYVWPRQTNAMVSSAAHVSYVRILKEYASSRSLHSHLLKSGFMPNYICWTKHEETGVVIEEGEEEQWDDDDIIAEYGAFNDTAMGEAEEEVGAEDEPTDDLGQAIHDA